MKMRMRSVRVSAVLLSLVCGSESALADLPAVMDHVPQNASMVVAFRNIGGFTKSVKDFATALNMPMGEMGEENPVAAAEKMLAIPGIKSDGAMAMIALADEAGNFVEDRGVILVPVTDFDAMAKGLKAEKAGEVWGAEVEGKQIYFKSGSGYAVLGEDQALVGSFEMTSGNAARLTSSLGSVGQRIGDTSDLVVYLNAGSMRSKMQESVGGMGEGMEEMAAMGVPNAEAFTAGMGAMKGALESMVRDASAAIVGFTINEQGLSIDAGGQFTEGSETAAKLAGTANAGSLMGRLPSTDFYFAGAFDSSSPMMQSAIKALSGMSEQGSMKALVNQIDNVTGMSFVVGASPAGLMGGVLANMVTYTACKDAAKYAEGYYGELKAMDGKDMGGMTFKVTHTPQAAEISGTKVDTWSMAAQPDPNDPDSMQVMMMQQMLFGPGGMQGMTAVTKDGVVATMSQNSVLMTQALSAASSGEGLSSAKDLQGTQRLLPQNRMVEFYVGTRPLLEAINGAMAMWMGGAEDVKVAADVAPIGFAMSAQGGGAGLHLHIPMSSAKAIGEFAKAMRGQFEGDDMMGDEPMGDDAPPRF